MSFLDKVFKGGRKRKAEKDDSQKAIENLKEMEDMLVKKQLVLEDKIQQVKQQNTRKYKFRKWNQPKSTVKQIKDRLWLP